MPWKKSESRNSRSNVAGTKEKTRKKKEGVIGAGDNLLAAGLAKGAAARGKRIAFGDNNRIIWDHNSESIFLGNPNVAKPGSEQDKDIEWVNFYRGNRIYNYHDQERNRWRWNYQFKAQPGEVFLLADERRFASRFGKGFILVESRVPTYKPSAVNKQWGGQNWNALVAKLRKEGHRVVEAAELNAPDFRHALAVMENASLYIGPEGGLHHGAAALGVKAAVIFGAWIPPQVTGYDTHVNIAEGVACGSLYECQHCLDAMERITVHRVHQAAMSLL